MEHENAYIRKLLIVVLLLTGLTAVKAATSWYFRTVDVKDGLADNFVRDIATDSEGYVWLSTINGVSRYDGYRFLNFQPQHYGGRTGDVEMVRQTADGTLWMRCTSGELFTYRPATQTWQKDGMERLRQMGMEGSSVSAFFGSDGLHNIVFSNNAALTATDGTVLLGSLSGYVSIPPSNIQRSDWLKDVYKARTFNVQRPTFRVCFTEFRINGNTVVKSPQGFSIDYGERLGVSVSIMMPALSHKARYLYRFKGEDEWMKAPSNMLYFASLIPGNHVLQQERTQKYTDYVESND